MYNVICNLTQESWVRNQSLMICLVYKSTFEGGADHHYFMICLLYWSNVDLGLISHSLIIYFVLIYGQEIEYLVYKSIFNLELIIIISWYASCIGQMLIWVSYCIHWLYASFWFMVKRSYIHRMPRVMVDFDLELVINLWYSYCIGGMLIKS